jgi:N4-gp56 family major capsid protein
MDTSIGTSHAVTQENFLNYCFREYVDKLVLKPYMGMNTESVIHVKDVFSKNKGDAVTFNLASKLEGEGVQSGGTMEGNEEAMNFYGQRILLDEYRNAVKDDGTMSRQRTPFELKQEFEPALTTWLAQKVEKQLFQAMNDIDGVIYPTASAAQKNAWNPENIDRVLFGVTTANYNATHSTALSNIDSTNDTLSTLQISLAKRRAQLCNPKVRPIKIDNGEEYYVMFVHNLCARDLKNSDAWAQAQRLAQFRGDENPLFTGMLGVWDGVILKESPKIQLVAGVGASNIDVAINALCGAQALLFAQGDYPEQGGAKVVLTEKLFDYDTQVGMQIKALYAYAKAVFNSHQHGIVTVFSAAVDD